MDTRQQAQQRIARLGALADMAVRQSRGLGISLRSQVIAFYRQDIPIESAFDAVAETLERAVQDAMIGAHLQGRLDALLLATKAMRRSEVRKHLANRVQRAVGFLANRLQLTPAELAELNATYGPAAGDVAGGFSAEVQGKISRELAAINADGAPVNEGVKRLRSTFDAAGVSSSEVPGHLLETIYRTQTQLAYSAGDWNADQDPIVQEILWGYEYATVGDDRVRPTHAALDGVRMPKDDPRWEAIRPPNGFNCRCTLLKVFDTDRHHVVEPKDEKTVQIAQGGSVKVRPGPDVGFDFNPGRVFGDTLVGGRGFIRRELLKATR